jgi:BASS family bile acid:Na+ symporter
MPDSGFLPWSMFSAIALVTVFTVMFAIGLAIEAGELRWTLGQPALVARALMSVLVLMPVVAVMIGRVTGLSREAEIAVALMAISPGAPVALRRSMDAGGHHSFAAALQLLIASLAIVTMPLWVIGMNAIHGTHGDVSVRVVAQQVLIAQLIPLALGFMLRRVWPHLAARFEPAVRRLAGVMLSAFAIVVLASIWRLVFAAGLPLGVAAVAITASALALGHMLGGPRPETRTAVAISSGLRNPGLALLVATGNHAPAEVVANIFAYLMWAAVTVTIYVAFRRRADTSRG